jgi:hypothetical protein
MWFALAPTGFSTSATKSLLFDSSKFARFVWTDFLSLINGAPADYAAASCDDRIGLTRSKRSEWFCMT